MSKNWLIVLTQTDVTKEETLKPMQQKWIEGLKNSYEIFSQYYRVTKVAFTQGDTHL